MGNERPSSESLWFTLPLLGTLAFGEELQLKSDPSDGFRLGYPNPVKEKESEQED